MFVRMYVCNYVYIDMHSYIERQMETGKNFSTRLHARCFGRHKTYFDFRVTLVCLEGLVTHTILGAVRKIKCKNVYTWKVLEWPACPSLTFMG